MLQRPKSQPIDGLLLYAIQINDWYFLTKGLTFGFQMYIHSIYQDNE